MAVKAALPQPQLPPKANKIRQLIIEMLSAAQSGHSAGPLGMTDVFTALYFHLLKIDAKDPDWPDRDRLILSNGHICPVLYATLAEAGFFPKEELFTLRQFGSRLEGHPHLGSLPGIENSSGPLGQGLSLSAGLALAFQRDEKTNQVICITSDGEHQEGQTWEAYMLAAKYNLGNLINFVDRNQIQISGFTKQVMPIKSLKEKISSFGWQVLEIDGHNFREIIDAYHQAQQETSQPTAIICHTIPGKGVSFMENKPEWHGKPPSEEEAKQALEELKNE